MRNSKIEWTDHTFNPWEGCTKVSPGCLHCYAEARNSRWHGGTAPNWGKGAPRRRTSETNWQQPVKWNRTAEQSGVRKRVFCASLADWLDDEVPVRWLADLMKLVVETPCLDWLLLTKRPQNFRKRMEAAYMEVACGSIEADDMMFRWESKNIAPENVWIGTTVEDQQRADERIPQILQIPAQVRFLSCEPLLGPVTLRSPRESGGWTYFDDPLTGERATKQGTWKDQKMPRIHWVIVGGESGPGARKMNKEWAISLRDQCTKSGVPFHFKQWGGPNKKATGRILEGQTYDELPALALV